MPGIGGFEAGEVKRGLVVEGGYGGVVAGLMWGRGCVVGGVGRGMKLVLLLAEEGGAVLLRCEGFAVLVVET